MTGIWQATTIAALEAEARERTGLDDFGDPAYRTALSVLLAGYAENTVLSEEGAAAARAQVVDLLSRRLKSENALKQFGAGVSIARPWLILAWPRSGTTALHRVLCADPAAQGLEYWLGICPQPRPPEDQWPNHPDYRAAVEQLACLREALPRLFAQHAMQADDVDECRLMLMQDFANITFCSNATLPRYEALLWSCDMTAAYRRHRALLEMIDGGQGRRWILKDPSHLMSLDALYGEYPDLRVICTRRSAMDFLPSVASLVFEGWRSSEPGLTREEVGRAALRTWSRAARELQRWRAAHPEIPWFDVEQHALRNDPIGSCRALYAAFGEELSSEARIGMCAVLDQGLHVGATLDKPTLEMFGLTRAEVSAAFPEEFL